MLLTGAGRVRGLKQPVYMGLSGHQWNNQKQLFDISQKSIYYWWWQFLRLTPEFWYAQHTGHAIADPQLKQVFASIGGHPSHSFKAWWQQVGQIVFAEGVRADCVKLMQPHSALPSPQNQNPTVCVEVPLSLNKREITRQFIAVLNTVHRGRNFDVQAYSNALLRLYNHRYNLSAIERQYWVMLYRLIYPHTPLWVIGDRLQLASHLAVRHLERSTAERRQEKMFLQLQSQTWRYHAQAQALRVNVKLGSFANYTKPDKNPTDAPFGPALDSDFKAMTSEAPHSNSAWKLWVKRHYQNALHQKITTVNRLDKQYEMNAQFAANLAKFVRGGMGF